MQAQACWPFFSLPSPRKAPACCLFSCAGHASCKLITPLLPTSWSYPAAPCGPPSCSLALNHQPTASLSQCKPTSYTPSLLRLHYTLLLLYKRGDILPWRGWKKNHIGEERKLPVDQGKRERDPRERKKKGKKRKKNRSGVCCSFFWGLSTWIFKVCKFFLFFL